jgi:aminomethyltransferase
MSDERRTALFARHKASGAQMVSFGGWAMPLAYSGGILTEHLTTRRSAGVFDVSHMGRFAIRGRHAITFLRRALTNDAAVLATGQSHYTLLADDEGSAIDDAYLLRYIEDSYLLVVNAANRDKDWRHLQQVREEFDDAQMEDLSEALAMLSVQGPRSEDIVRALIEDGPLPAPRRNATSVARFAGTALWLSRTGYTGEPLGFELCVAAHKSAALWDRIIELGAGPVGLGARDTLRLEAGLPLYGHELGLDPEGRAIPIFALAPARFAVNLSVERGDFTGKTALRRQFDSLQAPIDAQHGADPTIADANIVPRQVRPLEMIDPGIARPGAMLFCNDRPAGHVTSGTMVPYWRFTGDGADAVITQASERRAIALALIDRSVQTGDVVQVDIRGKRIQAGVMPTLLSGKFSPYARPVTWRAWRRGGAAQRP